MALSDLMEINALGIRLELIDCIVWVNLSDKDLQLGAGIGPSSGISCSRGYINRHEYTAKVGQTSRLERTRRARRGRRRPHRTESQPIPSIVYKSFVITDHAADVVNVTTPALGPRDARDGAPITKACHLH